MFEKKKPRKKEQKGELNRAMSNIIKAIAEISVADNLIIVRYRRGEIKRSGRRRAYGRELSVSTPGGAHSLVRASLVSASVPTKNPLHVLFVLTHTLLAPNA